MITLKVSLEYGTFPVWMYDESDWLIDNGLPDDLYQDKQLLDIFVKIQNDFESIYVDNEREFYGKGFDTVEEEQAFRDLIKKAVKMLEERSEGKYKVVNAVKYYT